MNARVAPLHRVPRLLLSGVALIVAALIIGSWHRWVPVEFAINLDRISETTSLPFRADITELHNIVIEVKKSGDTLAAICAISPRRSNSYLDEECKTHPEELAVAWRLLSGSRLVAEGQSSSRDATAGGRTLERWVGRVSLDKAVSYRLEVKTLQPAPFLSKLSPRAKVAVFSKNADDHAVVAAIAMQSGTLIALIGVAQWLIRGVVSRRERSA